MNIMKDVPSSANMVHSSAVQLPVLEIWRGHFLYLQAYFFIAYTGNRYPVFSQPSLGLSIRNLLPWLHNRSMPASLPSRLQYFSRGRTPRLSSESNKFMTLHPSISILTPPLKRHCHRARSSWIRGGLSGFLSR